MRFVVTRHGESHKTEEIYGGRSKDILLTKKGEKDAIALQGKESILAIQEVYSSPIKRAYETAKLVCPNKEIYITDLLQERSLGIFEGQLIKEVENKYPQYSPKGEYKNFRHDFRQKAPEGENYTDATQRVEQFLEKFDLKEKKVIGIFSHICLIRCLLFLLLDLEEEKVFRLWIPNTEPIIVEGEKIGEFNLVSHSIEDLLIDTIRK